MCTRQQTARAPPSHDSFSPLNMALSSRFLLALKCTPGKKLWRPGGDSNPHLRSDSFSLSLGPHRVCRRTGAPDNSVLVSHYNTRHGSETDSSSHQGDTLRPLPTVPFSTFFGDAPLWGTDEEIRPSLTLFSARFVSRAFLTLCTLVSPSLSSSSLSLFLTALCPPPHQPPSLSPP